MLTWENWPSTWCPSPDCTFSCQDSLLLPQEVASNTGKFFYYFDTYYIKVSMTSLFAHKVAQLTKWRFLPKNLKQLVIFVIRLAFTWSRVDKNRTQFQKTNYIFQKMKLSQNGCSTNLITKTETKNQNDKID